MNMNEYMQIFYVFLKKILIIKELDDDFPAIFDDFLKIITHFLFCKTIESKEETIEKILKIYWILERNEFKQKLESILIGYFKHDRNILSKKI